jgi:hypothetical protein
MGAFDQFKDQADEFADKAKSVAGNKRNKAADDMENPEQMERGLPQDGQERGSQVGDRAREGMDSESDDQDNWA